MGHLKKLGSAKYCLKLLFKTKFKRSFPKIIKYVKSENLFCSKIQSLKKIKKLRLNLKSSMYGDIS